MYKDHPTWKMLEKAKTDLKKLRDDMRRHPHYDVIASAHNSIIKMQYALEAKLCQEE